MDDGEQRVKGIYEIDFDDRSADALSRALGGLEPKDLQCITSIFLVKYLAVLGDVQQDTEGAVVGEQSPVVSNNTVDYREAVEGRQSVEDDLTYFALHLWRWRQIKAWLAEQEKTK